ncbi:MAG TPA: hypothetical protein VKB95_06360 [Chitinophagaceae bacterium]|nr:hypothetical protein [Chitinophagaceae bacterium]
MYKLFTLFFCLFISVRLYSQREYGLEYQHGFGKSYNSNSIGGLFENLSNGPSTWQVGIQYTWDIFVTNKKTQGISDFGILLGYRYHFSYGSSGNLIAGVRTTFSFLTEKAYTKFTPSLEFGYHYTFNNFYDGGFTTSSLNLGYDIPIGKEKSEDHKGFLFIPRIAAGYRY